MVVCLLLALQWGGSVYPWSNGRIIALFVIFAVLLVVFSAIQVWKKDNATIPLRVVKKRSVAASAAFSALLGASFFSFIYFVPIWLQAIKGASAVKSGIMNLPMILGLVIMSVGAGIGVTTLGYYTPFCIASSCLMSIGAGLMTTWTTSTDHEMWIAYQALYGFGVGLGMQQPLIAVQTVLSHEDVPMGTAIIMFAQTLGGALFISAAQNVFTNKLVSNLAAVVPDLNPAIVISSGATSLAHNVPAEYLAGVQIAYNAAITNSFYVGLAMAVLSIFGAVSLEWKSVKGVQLEMAAA